jgi:hypothetical protein
MLPNFSKLQKKISQKITALVITDQLIDAFAPFQSLTPEGLNKLSATLQKSAVDLDLKFQF